MHKADPIPLNINSPSWTYRDGELCCEGVPLATIAKKFGTPTYVYSRAHLEWAFTAAERAWKRKHLICFSLKSNSNRAVAAVLARLGAGADVVSGGELFRAGEAGIPADRIVFAGVGKTDREIREALRAGILFFTVESIPETERIDRQAAQLGVKAPIALRVTPDVDPKTHRYITTSKPENKFGLDLEEAAQFYENCRNYPNVKPVGIQMHIGSQILSTRPYLEAVAKLVKLVDELAADGVRLEYFDIGGGMGIRYRDETPATAADFAREISRILGRRRLTVILEPGRSICGNAGCLLARTIYFKHKQKRDFLILDAGMNDLIRPSLYGAHHEIVPVIPRNTPTIRAEVVGPICETGDILGSRRRFPRPRQGDLFAVLSAGAYGFTMSSTYNSRPRSAEVMVDGTRCELIRRRETYRDLVRGEKLPSFLG